MAGEVVRGCGLELKACVTHAPGGRPLTGPIDLSVAAGQIVSLVGPSGAGKSTLLRLMAGLLKPHSGTIAVTRADGGPVRIGLAPQSPALLPWLTVIENVLMPVGLGAAKREVVDADRARAAMLLDRFGLEAPWRDRSPDVLSGGMQSRVALARALIGAPDLLLLDEPFGSLDEVTAETILAELASVIADRGCTTVLVSHNLHQAALLADRVIVMSASPGRIGADISVDHVAGVTASDDPAVAASVAEIRTALRRAA